MGLCQTCENCPIEKCKIKQTCCPDGNHYKKVVTNKPYFLPLIKKHYLKIKNGTQRSEIRPANHRGWNVKNIYIGRYILFSMGYGKQDRVLKEIVNTMSTHDLTMEDVSLAHIVAVEKIYGKRDRWLIARVS